MSPSIRRGVNIVVEKKVAETGNKTSLRVMCVGNLRNSPRVPGALVAADGGKSISLLNAMRGRLARLFCVLCCCCPWPLFRRSGVCSGKDSRWQARTETGDAANSCVALLSASGVLLTEVECTVMTQ
jgi:hypothetical protein